jgi:hypothetical protein
MVIGGGLLFYDFVQDAREAIVVIPRANDLREKHNEQKQRDADDIDKLFPPKKAEPACEPQ